VPKHTPENTDLEPLTRIQILMAMAITAIVLLIVAKLWIHWGAVTLLPIRLTGLATLQGMGLGLIITLLSSMLYRIWGTYRRNADFYLQRVLQPLEWSDLIWLGLLPGLSEELVFRGVMLPAFGYDAWAVLFSSLCFGVTHLSNLQQWAYVLWATVVGGMLGASALFTNNLLVPIVAHVFINLASSCLWNLTERRKTRQGEVRR
jgi:hypothetical protein